jgi:hypothetical protein
MLPVDIARVPVNLSSGSPNKIADWLGTKCESQSAYLPKQLLVALYLDFAAQGAS